MNQVFAAPVGADHLLRRASLKAPVAYVVGLMGGAATTAGLVVIVGTAVSGAPGGKLVVFGAALAISGLGIRGELTGTIAPLPERKRQVPKRWLQWRHKWLTAVAYGYVLGMGFWTLLHHAAAYAALGCLMLLSPVLAGAAAGVYAAARAWMLFTAWFVAAQNPGRGFLFARCAIAPRWLAWTASAAVLAAGVLWFIKGA